MTTPLEPDADQVEAQHAKTLLELAGAYTRQALARTGKKRRRCPGSGRWPRRTGP